MKEMSDNQRLLLAMVLMIAVIAIWGKFYKSPAPPPAPPAAVGSTAPAGNSSGNIAIAGNPGAAPAAAKPATAVEAREEKTIVVESPLYRIELSNRGGVVRSWKLKKYLDDQKPPKPLDLVNTSAAQQFGAWPLALSLDDPSLENQANSALYAISAPGNAITAPADLILHWSDGHLDITKHLKFNGAYETELEISATLDGRALPVAVGWRGGFGDVTAAQESQLVNVFYRENGKLTLLPYKKLGMTDHPEVRAQQTGVMEFAGIEDQFFTAAFLPNGPGVSLWHWSEQHDITADDKPAKEPIAEMAAGSPIPGPLSLRVFVGPKDLHILSTLRPNLEELVQFGWTGIIAKPLLEILQWSYKYVPNYGWAIVLITLAINTALFPLKMKSWRSMQKMQRVGPEMRSIQDRYKKYSMNDPRKRKMNEEMMALYSREGINPFGSCLPMVLQMPIWWALYRMLMGAIELRHAPWIGWVHDLSARDPYYILPALMVLTMYLMQKMTPTTTVDPAQQKMLALMPIMMGVFFFRLSSGLILYIFTSNMVGIAQQYFLNRTEPLSAKATGGNKKT